MNPTGDIDFLALPGIERFTHVPLANLHFTLFPSRLLLERGLNYYADERVSSLSWNAEGERLDAKVNGSGSSYSVSLSPVGEGLTHRCECPAWQRGIGCKHTIAVYALIVHLFEGRLLYYRAPHKDYLQFMGEMLAKSAKPGGGGAASKKLKAKTVITAAAESPIGDPTFYSEHKAGQDLLRSLGFGISYVGGGFSSFMESAARRAFTHRDVRQAWPALLSACAVHGAELYFEFSRNGSRTKASIRLQPKLVEAPYKTLLDRAGGAVGLSISPLDEEQPPLLWADADLGLGVDKAGRLVAISNDCPFLWMDNFNEFNHFASSLGGYIEHPSALQSRNFDGYNARALGFDLAPFEYSPENLSLSVDGEPQQNPQEPAEAVFTLSVYCVSGGQNPLYHAYPTLQVEDAFIDAQALLKDLCVDILGDVYESRTWGSKGRAERLSAALHNLFLLETKAERSTCITEAVSHPHFKRARLTNKGRACLRKVEKKWVDLDSSVTLLSWDDQFDPDGLEYTLPRWLLTRIPRKNIARAALAIWQTRSMSDLRRFGETIEFQEDELAPFLFKAMAVASATGMKILVDDEPLRRAPVQIEIEARESDSIDWFELKAQIRCESLTLSDKQWQQLIAGNLIFEDEEGQLVVPDIGSQAVLLQSLRSLTSADKKGGHEARIPRLQILDWLELRKHGASVKLPASAEALFKSLQNFSELPSKLLPEGVDAELRPYQHRGYEWLEFLYGHRFGACLADDMGLGKTLQAICFLAAHTATKKGKKQQEARPHLIVVPPSLLFNWASEIERFCPRLGVAEYAGPQRDWNTAQKASIILTTYDILRIDQKLFAGQPFDIAIFDEAQVVKNISTARAKAARAVKSRFTLCLTGTPMENHLGEYHAIIDLALPGLMGTVREFNQALKNGDQERLLRRAQPFVLRRKKERILDELPPKVESDLYLDMTPAQKELYTRTVGEVRKEVLEAYADKPRQQAGIMALAALTRLRQVCISPGLLGAHEKQVSPKFEHLIDTLAEIHDEGHSALLFSQFTKALDLLQAELERQKLPFLRLDGSTPTAKRKKAVREFQESDTPHTFLISLKAGGAGLNLTRASYVFHLDPWWNPAVEHQASDRAHRIGQQQTVFVKRLLMRHTVEEKIQLLKARKQALFDAVVENPAASRATNQVLSPEDFQFLLND